MSQPSEQPWSSDPNAPQIPFWLYTAEKENFAGMLLGAIFYGVVVVLFFQCMCALFDPINRTREGIRWGLVTYTVLMFSFVTVFVGMNLNIQSFSYIDNRAFPGKNGIPPGPLGFQFLLYSDPISFVPNFMFLLNNWLADGLLLYRCYIIYYKNLWVVGFPCLMYLASIAMGIATDYTLAQTDSVVTNSAAIHRFGVSYFSITLSLNVILTLMVVGRLYLHNRMLRNAEGIAALTGPSYTSIVTMLVESCALYAACLLLYIIPWGTKSYVEYVFLPLLADVQVIAPFLIILRVAHRRSFSSDTAVSETVESIKLRSRREITIDNDTHLDEYPLSSTDRDSGKTLAVGVVTTIDFHHDEP